VTEAWLRARFDQLMKLDLVELDDDYYEDDPYFKNPNDLDQKFSLLEEENLFYIHRIQEYEQLIEDAQYKIDDTHSVIENKIRALNENRDNLKNKIDHAQANLEQFRKQSFGNKIVDQNSVYNKQVTKNNKKQQEGINCDEMLGAIKKKIGEIKKHDSTKEPL